MEAKGGHNGTAKANIKSMGSKGGGKKERRCKNVERSMKN